MAQRSWSGLQRALEQTDDLALGQPFGQKSGRLVHGDARSVRGKPSASGELRAEVTAPGDSCGGSS